MSESPFKNMLGAKERPARPQVAEVVSIPETVEPRLFTAIKVNQRVTITPEQIKSAVEMLETLNCTLRQAVISSGIASSSTWQRWTKGEISEENRAGLERFLDRLHEAKNEFEVKQLRRYMDIINCTENKGTYANNRFLQHLPHLVPSVFGAHAAQQINVTSNGETIGNAPTAVTTINMINFPKRDGT